MQENKMQSFAGGSSVCRRDSKDSQVTLRLDPWHDLKLNQVCSKDKDNL
jgi:hypothetical protein